MGSMKRKTCFISEGEVPVGEKSWGEKEGGKNMNKRKKEFSTEGEVPAGGGVLFVFLFLFLSFAFLFFKRKR